MIIFMLGQLLFEFKKKKRNEQKYKKKMHVDNCLLQFVHR